MPELLLRPVSKSEQACAPPSDAVLGHRAWTQCLDAACWPRTFLCSIPKSGTSC